MSKPIVGQTAPDTALQDQFGQTHTISGYTGKYVLLYFYPKDDTPGCTKEACGFRDNFSALSDADVVVLGVSADTTVSHKKFADKFSLNFPLLADVDHTLAKAYGVYGEKTLFGKQIMGIHRESFLIGPDGTILKHYKKVKPTEHPTEVLTDITQIKNPG